MGGLAMTLFRGRYRVESARLVRWDYTRPAWYFVTLCTRKRACVLGDVIDGRVRLSPIGRIVAEEWRRTSVVRENVRLDAWVIMPNHLHGIIRITRAAPRVGSSVECRGDSACDPFPSDAAAETGSPATDTGGITNATEITNFTGVTDSTGIRKDARRASLRMRIPVRIRMPVRTREWIRTIRTLQRRTPRRRYSIQRRDRVWNRASLGAIIGQFKSACTRRIRARYPDFAWQARFYDSIIRDPEALERVRRYIARNPARWARDRDKPAGPFM
jgi:putative transposase